MVINALPLWKYRGPMATELADILARNLKKLRKSRGFTQESLAEAAGLSLGGYQHIEYGHRWPSDVTLHRISEAMRVPVTAFFSDKELAVTPTPEQALEVLGSLVRQRKS